MTEDDDRAARYSDLFAGGSPHQHPSDCAYCPICATIAVVRKTKPEVLEHLAAAARELIIAAGILLEEAEQFVGTGEPGTEPDGEGGETPRVRRIDVG